MPNPFTVFARNSLPPGIRFEGHAIVSADGMISDADGGMPAMLRNEADQRHFRTALDASALVVLGRLGHRRHGNPGRRRLVFTSSVDAMAPDAEDAWSTLYNPTGTPLDEVLAGLGIVDGIVAVTGGTRVFDAFLPLYDAFDLVEVHEYLLRDGRPCFANGHPRSVLAANGLLPVHFSLIDPIAGVSLTRWVRG